MKGVFDDGHRCQGATTHTSHPVETEFQIGAGFAFFYLQFTLKIFQDDVATADMAGRAETYFDRIFPRRMKTELVINGCDAIDFTGLEVEMDGYQLNS